MSSGKTKAVELPTSSENVTDLYDRIFKLLEAGLVEIVVRPTTPARRKAALGARGNTDVIRFLEERVTEAPKMSVGVQELLAGYMEWARQEGLALPNNKTILGAMEPAMKEVHGLCQRNDVKRNGKNVRGYYGVCMFVPPTEEGSDS